MSAISVAWNNANHSLARQLQQSMLAAQSLYGAGHSFSWSDNHISLGGTLSNFLPEDRFDRQPLWSPDRSACLVADVRLDNRAELARTLNLVHPEELADSAFLMAAWLRWGSTCLDHIIGGFAFAVWTPSRQELFAARDHVGERPLFYHRGKHLFALASMPKGLLALPGLSSGFDENRLADWLACVHPDWNKSFFAGIERLPLGHMLRVTPDSFECKSYWHPSSAKPTRYKRDEDYAEALLEIFDRATEARLRTTRLVGSHLSAGLDSSSVTASAAHLLGMQGKGLSAFTAVPRPDFNNICNPGLIASEGAAAAEVARMYPNVQHFLVDTGGRDLLDTMKAWTDAMDEPSLNVVNILWLSAILDQARQRGIGVMLEGSSGNVTISWETWSIFGYLFRRLRWIELLKITRSLRAHGEMSFKAAARLSLTGLLPAWCDRKLVPAGSLATLYSPLIHPDAARGHALDARIFENRFTYDPDLGVQHARFFERFDFGPMHAATQALAQIEVRDPAADKRIYDFCFSIPPEQYFVDGHSRSLVRRAMKGRLPESTRLRYARGHQGADWYLSMSEALPSLRREVALFQQSPVARHTLDLPRMHDLLDTWPQSGYEKTQVSELWHNALIRGISMGYFLRSHDSSASIAEDGPSHCSPDLSADRVVAPQI
jgi:asparagine synthase (glutamine-hydrolysing)